MLNSYDDFVLRFVDCLRSRQSEFERLSDRRAAGDFVGELQAAVARHLGATVRENLWGVDAVWCRNTSSRQYVRANETHEFPLQLPLLAIDIESDAGNAEAAFLRLVNVGASFRVLVVIADESAVAGALNALLDARDNARQGGLVTPETDLLAVFIALDSRPELSGHAVIIGRQRERRLVFP